MKISELNQIITVDRMRRFSKSIELFRAVFDETMSRAGYVFHHGKRLQNGTPIVIMYSREAFRVTFDWYPRYDSPVLDMTLFVRNADGEQDVFAKRAVSDGDIITDLSDWIVASERRIGSPPD